MKSLLQKHLLILQILTSSRFCTHWVKQTWLKNKMNSFLPSLPQIREYHLGRKIKFLDMENIIKILTICIKLWDHFINKQYSLYAIQLNYYKKSILQNGCSGIYNIPKLAEFFIKNKNICNIQSERKLMNSRI